MLCPICTEVPARFFFGNRDEFGADQSGAKYFELPFTVTTLRQSALSGCELCTLLSSNLIEGFGRGESDRWSTNASGDSLPYNENIRVSVTSGDGLAFVGMEEGKARRGVLRFDAHGIMKPIAEHSDSKQCFQQLDDWIQDCIQNHHSCRPINSSDEHFLPTRLLDVGRSDIESKSIRLVLSSDLRTKDDVRYLSLSHCWGKGLPQSATTTLATLDSRLQSIPLEALSKNFRDLCLLARKLGVGYAWIDSLCIIQDSLEDWTRESRLMGKVYSHSYCTIGAALHPDVHDVPSQQSSEETGFLAPRTKTLTGMATLLNPLPHGAQHQPLDVPSASTTMKASIGSDDTTSRKSGNIINLRSHLNRVTAPLGESKEVPERVRIFPVLPKWSESYDQCPLSDRGWTLQERALSVRNVFYTRDQMIWECQMMQATEQLPNPWKHDETQSRLFSPPSRNKAVNLHKWYVMVEDYTQRKLSYQTDKLPAISGLADSFEGATGLTRYVAGLWEEDLIEGLLWSVEKPWWEYKDPSDWEKWREREYLAPSWSWASVEVPVEWWSRNLVKHWSEWPNSYSKLSLLEFETIPQGVDPRGRLTKGWLRIKGILRKLEHLPQQLWPETGLGFDGESYDKFRGKVLWDFPVVGGCEGGFFVLPIYLAPRDGHIRHSLGLLLTPTGESENTYRRLGLVSHLPPEHYQDLLRQPIFIV